MTELAALPSSDTPLRRTGYARWLATQNLSMWLLCIAFTVIIVGLLALVTGYLVGIGWDSLSLDFFTETPTGDVKAPGGMLHGIVGTLILMGLACIVGIPVGMLTGIYLSEYGASSMIAAPVRFTSDVLAGVPSIVVGILGYELLVAPLGFWDGYLWGIKILPNGNFNGWAGALALAFIMVPIVARTTEEMLRLVPNSYREASVALGATKSYTILRVVVPAATGSIITGVMLAIARVAGETAPLLFTALGASLVPVFREPGPYVHPGDINYPFPSLTKQIFDYASGPYPEPKRLAWAGILVLISLIFILNLSVRLLMNARLRRLGQ